ncbi:MAG: hemerythrin domain-containing protein [Bacteroidia bacterium]|nr:hemerythrin domain-containing protein [Bacteroidia bacterium]
MNLRSGSGDLVSSSELMRMVEGDHMRSTYSLFENIKVLLEAALSIDAEVNPGLPAVYSEFVELKEMFRDHQERETRMLFPVFNSNEWAKVSGSVTRKELLHQIERLKRDHRQIRNGLAVIKKTASEFQPDPRSSPSLKLCYAQFFQLEQEINTHFFLEEEALFPKMADALKKTNK